ncbi:hypothetical protein [Nostoc sp. C057]|uniref:hypothetical protein n=1 Tax=Nostoc sp. C057 TaxID=2576903 RepID=UPI0015C39A76|nr:hypothetical protein [Nostoc sp. C057]
MGISEAVEEVRSLLLRLLKRLFGGIAEEVGSVSFGVFYRVMCFILKRLYRLWQWRL